MTSDRRITDTRPPRFARIRRFRAGAGAVSDRETVFLVGIAGLSIGFGLVWLPLGLIVPSVLLVILAIVTPPSPSERE